MSTVTLKLDLPEDWERLSFPTALNNRLRMLLDKQDNGKVLSEVEQQEALALCGLADMLALLKLRAERVGEQGNE